MWAAIKAKAGQEALLVVIGTVNEYFGEVALFGFFKKICLKNLKTD